MNLKKTCEKCNNALTDEGIAFICSYICTFCEKCTAETNYICPNCNEELARRPRRNKIPE